MSKMDKRDAFIHQLTEVRRKMLLRKRKRQRTQDNADYIEAVKHSHLDTVSLRCQFDTASACPHVFYDLVGTVIALQDRFPDQTHNIVEDICQLRPEWVELYFQHSSQILKNSPKIVEFSQYSVLFLSTENLLHDRFTFYSPVYDSFKGRDAGMCAWAWASSDQTVPDEDWYGRDEGHDGLANAADGEDFDEIYVTVDQRNILRVFFNRASGHDSSLVSALLIHATRDEVQLVVDNLRGMGVDVRHVSGLRKYG